MSRTSVPAVAYYRMSTDRQEASIPDQRAAVVKLAEQNGYVIIREYLDEGISGDDTEKRLGFLKMIDDAKRVGDFDAVLCWDQDRFGRFDPMDAGFWTKPLRDRGIYLHTVAQGKIDWDDFTGRIIYQVTQEGKHSFLRDMSRNVTRGMLAKAKRGLWLGGIAPYGYTLNDAKRLEPGEAVEVAVVRQLFADYAGTSVSIRALSDRLNADGIPGPGGRLWCVTSVHKILTRPVYVGDTVWNRRHIGKYHAVKAGEIEKAPRRDRRGSVANHQRDWVAVQDTHEPLVDRALFERVQKKLAERRDSKSPTRGGGDFLFTGLLKCGHCSWPMHGARNKSDRPGKTFDYKRYICGNYNLHGSGACKCNTVAEAVVLEHVIKAIKAEFLKPKRLAELKREIRRQEEAERAGTVAPTAAIDKRIAELDKDIATGTARFLTAPANLTDMLGAKLEEWRAERDTLAAKRRQLQKPAVSVEALDDAVDRIVAGLEVLDRTAATAEPAVVREVLGAFVEKVELFFRHEPYGTKRQRSVVERGRLYLREDLVSVDVSIDVPLARPDTTQTPARANPLAIRSVTFRP